MDRRGRVNRPDNSSFPLRSPRKKENYGVVDFAFLHFFGRLELRFQPGMMEGKLVGITVNFIIKMSPGCFF